MKQWRITTRCDCVPQQWRDHTTIVTHDDPQQARHLAFAEHRERLLADNVPNGHARLDVVSLQEVIEGTVEVKVKLHQLRAGDIVLPSRIRVLAPPKLLPGGTHAELVTTGDHGSQEPTTRRWKVGQRLLVERDVD